MSIFDTTANYGFNLIDFASMTWHEDEFDNWRKLDTLLTGIASTVPFAVDTGAADAYVVSYTPAITSYTSGLVISFAPAHTNTGASTINVNGLGTKSIKRQNAALSAGNIAANGYVKLTYNGDHFEMIDPRIIDFTISDGEVTPAKLSTGAPTWDSSGNETVSGNAMIDGYLKVDGDIKSGTDQLFFKHVSTSYASASITFSTLDPSGGNNGDIWLKYT